MARNIGQMIVSTALKLLYRQMEESAVEVRDEVNSVCARSKAEQNRNTLETIVEDRKFLSERNSPDDDVKALIDYQVDQANAHKSKVRHDMTQTSVEESIPLDQAAKRLANARHKKA